jgi:hypothetical protein
MATRLAWLMLSDETQDRMFEMQAKSHACVVLFRLPEEWKSATQDIELQHSVDGGVHFQSVPRLQACVGGETM